MKADVDPDDVFKRKADDRGRISLPTSEFKGKELEIAVLDMAKKGEKERETGDGK